MAMKSKLDREAFTMIEMLITLVIVSGILILIMIGSQRFSGPSLQTERAFWASFDSYWKQALYEAQYRGQKTEITIQPGSPVIFHTVKNDKQLAMPKSMHPKQSERILIRSNATVSPRTVAFASDIDQRTYRLVIQMGWGVYHVDRQAA
ncbi:hypothetical protein IWT25_02504 [Secundilactobacillus pentosiphilus]|uniref:Competence protein ComGD n=1 Tax=Secundilactobacillus pentosiphilus TaxID=1714682 RepID=A0A1Z5IZT7_9LACO|nr:type II secretion system protein [Secundilactobacillus pentosiphilus]GAX07156.1 hypothetical protein IWT25_02504 [Secundilactobacillus pentosiphilus]